MDLDTTTGTANPGGLGGSGVGGKVDVEQFVMDLEDKMLFRIQDLVEEDLRICRT